ncbi:SMI1/KNR4 family protein [Pseudomonas syringae]|nr:SMI1/KNR4 family protein [Pseudomonas syringae]
MKNLEEVRQLIEEITSAELFEGDYGDCVSNVDALLSGVEESDRKSVPADYLEFLGSFGFGELDAAFYVDDGPEKYSTICGREYVDYEGIYVIGGNSSDLLYAFDAKNDWQVVEVSSESDEIDVVASNFSDFILEQLKCIKSMIERRASH